MKKVLFLIHDLGQGGAEKVLINLVNNMDCSKFDITVMTLFDYGINRQFLGPNVKYKTWCKKMLPGNSHIMKVFSPQQLHNLIIKEHYDIEVAYLEGPCARIISGCPNKETKLISWIHIEQHTTKKASSSFLSIKEAEDCYNRFNNIICVSETVKQDFLHVLNIQVPVEVCYNTNESKKIVELATDEVEENLFSKNEFKIIGVGKLLASKGFDRILNVVKALKAENYPVHLYILGIGPMQKELEKIIYQNRLTDCATLLGYHTNPYK